MTYSYEKESPTNVGEAVDKILKEDDLAPEVGEIINEYGETYTAKIQECVDAHLGKYSFPFYVVVMHKKEMWAMNVLRNWFIGRKTKPTMKSMWAMFPNFMHTVYEVRPQGVELLWSLPSPQEAKTILDNWELYDSQLVKWCRSAVSEFMNVDSNSSLVLS